jgi:hypothetical protein
MSTDANRPIHVLKVLSVTAIFHHLRGKIAVGRCSEEYNVASEPLGSIYRIGHLSLRHVLVCNGICYPALS